MITLALTGSIGMGKSTVTAMFADAGIPTFDADAVVRRLQGPGGRLVPLIEERFPGTTHDGEVDRDALSTAVLGDRDELAAQPGLAQLPQLAASMSDSKLAVAVSVTMPATAIPASSARVDLTRDSSQSRCSAWHCPVRRIRKRATARGAP